MVSDEPQPLPPPGPSDHFNNLQVKRVRVTDGRSKRPEKNLVQHNVKIRARVRDQFEDAFQKARDAAGGDLTKGEFFELMFVAYQAKEGKASLTAAADIVRKSPIPQPEDKAEGRTVALEVFATPALAKGIKERARQTGWTISAVLENACAEAREAGQPCPHCEKKRGR